MSPGFIYVRRSAVFNYTADGHSGMYNVAAKSFPGHCLAEKFMRHVPFYTAHLNSVALEFFFPPNCVQIGGGILEVFLDSKLFNGFSNYLRIKRLGSSLFSYCLCISSNSQRM